MLQKPKAVKPEKPSPDFPLSPHDSGKWCKKIKGKLYYFGKWDDPWNALREYEDSVCKVANDSPKSGGKKGEFTLQDALNEFLEAKHQSVQSGNIVKRTFQEYEITAIRFAEVIGPHRLPTELTPHHYAAYRAHLVEKGYGVVTITNEIKRVKSAMTWIYRTYCPGLVPQFGPAFDKQSNTSLRRHKAGQKSKLLKPETILSIMDESGIHFRAMVLLGINCGFGPTDCARLPLKAAQQAIKTGWLKFPRTKTFVKREAALWPETIEAMRTSLSRRPAPKSDASKTTFFVAPNGTTYDPNDDGKAFLIQGRWKAAKKAARIEDGSFYCLRHTFNTIGRQTGDAGAVKTIMGHVDGTISEVYDHDVTDEHSINPERLTKVADAVRKWIGFH